MRLGPRTTFNMASCTTQIQRILAGASDHCDFIVIEGHVGRREARKRGEAFPSNKHHMIPARACNILPMGMGDHLGAKSVATIIRVLAGEAEKEGVQLGIKLEDEGIHIEVLDTGESCT